MIKSDKADWLKNLMQEIKIQNFESLPKYIIDEVACEPYYNIEDQEQFFSGHYPKFSNSIGLGEIFNLNDVNLKSDTIVNSLMHDFKSPLFIVRDENNINVDFSTILFSAINPLFIFNHANQDTFFQSNGINNKSFINIPNLGHTEQNPNNHSESFIYINIDLSNLLQKEIKNSRSFLNLESSLSKGVIINFQLGENFLDNLIKIRAFIKIWYNYLQLKKVPLKPFFMICEIKPSETFPEGLIDFSTKALGAILCNPDLITVNVQAQNDSEKRNARNTIHTILIEGKFELSESVLDGSYFIEQTSAQLAKHIWNYYF